MGRWKRRRKRRWMKSSRWRRRWRQRSKCMNWVGSGWGGVRRGGGWSGRQRSREIEDGRQNIGRCNGWVEKEREIIRMVKREGVKKRS